LRVRWDSVPARKGVRLIHYLAFCIRIFIDVIAQKTVKLPKTEITQNPP